METRKDSILIEPLRKDQYVYTIILFGLTIIAAFFLKNSFGTVISINGATAGNFIGLVLPASFYLKMCYEKKKKGVKKDKH